MIRKLLTDKSVKYITDNNIDNKLVKIQLFSSRTK
jgi:hypothetical protein